MAKKKILSVGFKIASDDVKYCPFALKTYLLDWDIILFRPTGGKLYQLKSRLEHWRIEIEDSIDIGKTVIVYLTDLEETYNQGSINNYDSIPFHPSPEAKKGSRIKLTPKNSELIAPYWKEFGEISSYKVILNQKNIPACLLTQHGNKTVGAIYRSKNSTGALILLPDIDFYPTDFVNDKNEWTKKAHIFAEKFVKTIVAMDKALKSDGKITPEPVWAKSPEYSFDKENLINSELLKVEKNLEILQGKKEQLLDELKETGRLRNLLFEKNKPLEHAILDALRILRFSASHFDDGESEFDAVFESPEGRFLGEAEGKDNKAIKIEKFDALTRHILEDLGREEVDSPAKGVLFGNPFRLNPLEERANPFSKKCVKMSRSQSVALVFTPDLFKVVQYLSNKEDSAFAETCRKAIFDASGRVQFPELPK